MYKQVERICFMYRETGQFWKRLSSFIAVKSRHAVDVNTDTVFNMTTLRCKYRD